MNTNKNKNLKTFFIYFLVFLLSYFVLIFIEINYKTKITAILTLILGTIIKKSYGKIISSLNVAFRRDKWKMDQIKLIKEGKLNDDSIIRISFAYLFRIKIDDKYFLVQNSRWKKFQPVGGAYKFYEKERYVLHKEFSFETDDCIPITEVTKDDYRGKVKSKYLKDFIKRFDKTNYRENVDNLSREFIEEVFSSGILDKEEFGDLSYRYCGRNITGIEHTKFAENEILLADIVEVVLTSKQESLFRKLIETDSTEYKFATANQIKKCGIETYKQNYKEDIGNHTYKILSENSDLLKKVSKSDYSLSVKL